MPWNATAVFITATLGVSVASYAPWALFCILAPLVSLLYGFTGFTITHGPSAGGPDHPPDKHAAATGA